MEWCVCACVVAFTLYIEILIVCMRNVRFLLRLLTTGNDGSHPLSKLKIFAFNDKIDLLISSLSKDGMVEILQKCLQQYSGVSILRARKNIDEGDEEADSTETRRLFDKLLEADTDSWDDEIRKGLESSEDMTTQKLTNEVQKTMVRKSLELMQLISTQSEVLFNR